MTLIHNTVFGPANRAVICTKEGDYLSKVMKALNGKYYEIDLLTTIASLQLPGVYVDVGAHYGNHTIFFAMECPATDVVAIEPNTDTIEGLKATLEANDIPWKKHRPVRIVHAAVHDTWHRAIVKHNRINTGNTTITKGVGDASEVPCLKLDEILRKYSKVAVIKCDVQYQDAEVLRSAIGILKRDWPLLAVEATRPQDLAAQEAVLLPLGYERKGRYCASATYIWQKP